MDEFNIIHQCEMDSLAEFSSEQDIATALGLKQSFPSSESFSSFNETRPCKQTKTNSWNSTITTDHLSPVSSPTSQFLSFDQPNHLYSFKPKDEVASPSLNIHFPHQISENQNYPTKLNNHNHISNHNNNNMSSYSMTKTPAMAKDHILAERKRREKLSQRFIALSAIVPGLKKVYTQTSL